MLELKKKFKAGACRIKGCARARMKARGLCDSHHGYLSKIGQLDEFGAPDKKRYFKGTKYKINKKPKKNLCHVIENSEKCINKSYHRGICMRHMSIFRLHGCVDKYALASQNKKTTFKIKQRIKPGVCRLIDGDARCVKKVSGRGLCSAHYNYFRKKGLLHKYGVFHKKLISKRDLKVNKKPKAGCCLLMIDGVACKKKINGLGLCRTHYASLKKNGLIEKFGKRSRCSLIVTLSLKKKVIKGRCRMVKNGKPCKNLTMYRGICKACHSALLRKGLLEKYATPRKVLFNANYTINKKVAEGVCRIKIEGAPCERDTYARGLCRGHHSNFSARGTLEKYALPSKFKVKKNKKT